jgi:hypothetical protein
MSVTARHIIHVDNNMLISRIQGHVSDVTNMFASYIYISHSPPLPSHPFCFVWESGGEDPRKFFYLQMLVGEF